MLRPFWLGAYFRFGSWSGGRGMIRPYNADSKNVKVRSHRVLDCVTKPVEDAFLP